MRGERGGCSTRSCICYVRTKKVIYLLKYSYYHPHTDDPPPPPPLAIDFLQRAPFFASVPLSLREEGKTPRETN